MLYDDVILLFHVKTEVMQYLCVVIFELWPNILSFVWFFKVIILCRFCQTLFLPEYLSIQLEILLQHSQSSHPLCSSGFIQDFLDHYNALQRQYLLTCKVRKYCILALYDSKPIVGFNVGSMVYMSGHSPFIAWMKTGGWTEFPYVNTHNKNTFKIHLSNVSIPGQRRR